MAQNPNIKDILAKVQNLGSQSSGPTSSLPSSIGVSPPINSLGSNILNPLTGNLMSENEEAKKLMDIQNQVSNLTTRLDYAGLNKEVDNVEDSRNFIEKLFNLPEKQNWLFDIFEIINRPQQAIFGGLENLTDRDAQGTDDGNFFKGFIEGLTGKKQTFGGQLLRNYFKDGEEEDGTFDWTDVAGFALDIFLDPADIALIPLTGGLSYLKKVPKTSKVFSEVDDIAKAGIELMNRTLTKPDGLKTAMRTAGYANEALLYSKAIEKTSLSGFVWKNIGAGLKSGAKMTGNLAEIALRGIDPNLGSAFATFKKGALENFTTTGKNIQRKVSEYFYVKGEVHKNYKELNAKFRNEFDTIFDNSIGTDEFITNLASKFDITNERTIANSLTANADEINSIFGDDRLAGKIADSILNRQPGEQLNDIVKNQLKNTYNQIIMNTYEFTKMSRAPITWDNLVDKVINQGTKQISYSEVAESTIRRALGDQFDDFVEVINIDEFKVLNFKQNKWNSSNYSTLKRLGRENLAMYDNLDMFRTAEIDFIDELMSSPSYDTPTRVEPLSRKKPELGPNERMMKDFSNENSARIITSSNDDVSSIRIQGQFTNADLLSSESLVLYDINKKGYANLSFELPDGKNVAVKIDNTNVPINIQINQAIGEAYGKKYTPFNKNSKSITNKDMEVFFEAFDDVSDDMLSDVDFDYTDAKYEAWVKDITGSFVRKDGRVRLTQKLYHNIETIVKRYSPEPELMSVLRKFDDEYGTMFEAKMMIHNELDAPASIIKKLGIEPTPKRWIYDIPPKQATGKQTMGVYQSIMDLSDGYNSASYAQEFLAKNEDALETILGKERFDKLYWTLQKGTKQETSIFGEVVEFFVKNADDTALGNHFKNIIEQNQLGDNIAEYISSGLPRVKSRLKTHTNSFLRKYKFGIGAPGAEEMTLFEYLGEADKKIFNSITNNGKTNMAETFDYFFRKYPELERLADPSVKKLLRGDIVRDPLTGRVVAGIPGTEGFITNRIPLGTFYTPTDIEQFKKYLEQDVVQQGLETFSKYFEEAQRIVSKEVFGDPEALINSSMSGYVPHVKMNRILSNLEGKTPEQAKVRAQELLKEITKHTSYENTNFEDMFVFGRTGAFKNRAFDMSAREANNLKTAYFRHSVANSDWFKTSIPEPMQEEVLEYFKKDMFSEDITTAFGDFLTSKSDKLIDNKRNSEILLSLAFGNPTKESSYFRIVPKGTAIPSNYTRLNTDNIANIRNTLDQLIEMGGKNTYYSELKKLLNKTMGKNATEEVFMENHLAKLFEISDKKEHQILTFMDNMNNFFKAGKVASPAFNMRNVGGNFYNMWVLGMESTAIPKYWTESMAIQKKFPSIDEKVVKQGISVLTPSEKEIYDLGHFFKKNGFFDKENLIRLNDLGHLEEVRRAGTSKFSKVLEATGISKLMDFNLRMNLTFDNTSRMALYRYAMDNPGFLRRLGFDETADGAMDAVRLALFDPNDLSFFERDVMKRLIPFYTWSRQNLAFQARNIMNNSSPYYKTYKTFEALWNSAGVNTEDLQEYERDQLYIPVPWLSKDGKYTALKLSLPLADLIEFSTPGEAFRRAMSSTTPLIRAPFEAVTGNVVFTGQPIERYEGEMSKNIPFLSKKNEWRASQIGLDVPLKVASGAIGSVVQAVKGTDVNIGEVQSIFENENFIRSVTNAINITAQPRDVTTNKLYQQYEKLDRLNALLKKQKDAGQTIPTLDDIAKAQSTIPKISKQQDQLASILEIVNKYKKR